MPVNKVGQGTDTTFPSTFVLVSGVKYSGLLFVRTASPEKNDPSPNATNANAGIVKPPMSNPTPLIVSLTATDFNPPKIA